MVDLHLLCHYLLMMMMITVWKVQGESSLTCRDVGICVNTDDNSCADELDVPGCEEEGEVCCTNVTSDRQSNRGCEALDAPDICVNLYEGKFQAECTKHRIDVGISHATTSCKCCGCKAKGKCLKKNGYGMKKDDSCEGMTRKWWAKGNECTCCIPDCPDTPDCYSAGGRCAKSCRSDEMPSLDIKCVKYNNDICTCCLPKNVQCPDPFTKVGEECFYRSAEDEARNWDDARTYCLALGGDLATPSNVILLREWLGVIGMPVGVWIGANDRYLHGYWEYLNSNLIDDGDWYTDEPSTGFIEHCLEISKDFSPPLNNYECHIVEGFVCQYDAPGCPPGSGCPGLS